MKLPLNIMLVLCAASVAAFAQDAKKDGPPAGVPGAPGGQDRRPPSPIMAALDTNKDGELDATEIANATASLKALDTNGDGKLSNDELRPARGQGGGRGPGGGGDRGGRPPGGPGGDRPVASGPAAGKK